MESLLAALESLLDERKQHPIFLVRAMKEGADVTLCAKHRAGKPNRLAALAQGPPTKLSLIIGGIHSVLLGKGGDSLLTGDRCQSGEPVAGRFHIAVALSTGSANVNVTPGPSFG